MLIAVLMSSILQAHAGRPSSPASPTPAPQQPQQTPPADPGATTSTTNPTNTPPSSGNTPPADENNAAQPGFLSTTGGQATAVVGGLVTLGVGAVAAKKGYKEYHAYQWRRAFQQGQVLRDFTDGVWDFQRQSSLTSSQQPAEIQQAAKDLSEHFIEHKKNNAHFNDRENAKKAHTFATTLLGHPKLPDQIKAPLKKIIPYLKSKL